MSSNNKQPIALVASKGVSHMSKAEIARREREEISVPFVDVAPPKTLPKRLRGEFGELANKLLACGIMTELDEEALARYLLAKESYQKASRALDRLMRTGKFLDLDSLNKLSALQDRAFKQVRSSAADLGLTAAARCRLVSAKVPDPPKNKFSKFSSSG
ncbi:MAG: phage terminase small subunit P27 family [Peptococcaceae bacterium]|nr:phage terminase small subunit P27 family [Peptococcaceae bacterium]